MRRLVAAIALVGLGLASLPAQGLPNGLTVETVASGFSSAVLDFCFLPDGRGIAAERAGGVRVFSTDGSFPPTLIGTLPNVSTGPERALLSLTADPNFAANGYVYVWFSKLSPSLTRNTVLARVTLTGDLANASSSNLSFHSSSLRTILNTPDNRYNHNGGTVLFGPDGMLYVSIGDDDDDCSAQSLESQRGCLLRLDVSGLPAGGSSSAPHGSTLVPGDNPLSGSGTFGALVIAYGLRNPVRMTCDQQTGDLFISDVGKNAREEFNQYVYNTGNLQLRNYGWPWREGSSGYTGCGGTTPSGLVGPITETQQGFGGWFSTMGGLRYRNQGGIYDLGASYEGRAFWTDYFSGQVREIQQDSNGIWSPAPPRPGAPSGTGNPWATAIT